jgi:hypothetical protein
MLIQTLTSKLNQLPVRQQIAELMRARSGEDVFPELALTLYAFIQRLHFELVESGVKDVFFMSREGQPLLEMFNRYSAFKNAKCEGKICGHYLEVSRRSTLLPSLGDLKTETFETLFRQYRAISLFEFLSSLGLENYISEVGVLLGIDDSAIKERVADLPTHQNFLDLLRAEKFQLIYERERSARRAAFMTYLTQLSGGNLPKTLAIVDVGWKGTIQDNLFNILCTGNSRCIESIDGYYLGLVAEGAASSHNRKHGLIFSCIGKRTEKFNVFNENRALFEVMLAADHGSITSYDVDDRGNVFPVRGAFDEEQMIKDKIFPVQKIIIERFCELLKLEKLKGVPQERLGRLVADVHSRMVFRPTPIERNWFSSIFHVENYGVFERSLFDTVFSEAGCFGKLKFCVEFVKRKGKVELGFWPYKTILEKGGYLIALAYVYIRRTVR